MLPVGSCTWTLGAQLVALFEGALEHLGCAALMEEVLTLVGLCSFVAPYHLLLPVFFLCVGKLQPLGFLLSLSAVMPSWPWRTFSVIVNQINCFFYSNSLLVMAFYAALNSNLDNHATFLLCYSKKKKKCLCAKELPKFFCWETSCYTDEICSNSPWVWENSMSNPKYVFVNGYLS